VRATTDCIADLRAITDLRAIADLRVHVITDLQAITDVRACAQVFDADCNAPLVHSCAGKNLGRKLLGKFNPPPYESTDVRAGAQVFDADCNAPLVHSCSKHLHGVPRS
jgi:hypothetical protein